jgi:hypothetical protein
VTAVLLPAPTVAQASRHVSVSILARWRLSWQVICGFTQDRRLGGPQSRSGHRLQEKAFRLCRGSNLDRPVVQPVARHYTDWVTRLTNSMWSSFRRSPKKLHFRNKMFNKHGKKLTHFSTFLWQHGGKGSVDVNFTIPWRDVACGPRPAITCGPEVVKKRWMTHFMVQSASTCLNVPQRASRSSTSADSRNVILVITKANRSSAS